MIYGSVCSGIEAASVAWEPLGFAPAWFSEIEPFPSAVLSHHWPEVANLGDMTKIADRILAGEIAVPDVMVGGTPCQAFSVAGARKGLEDNRGFLTIKFVELADAIDQQRAANDNEPAVIVWENVPGVLSSKDNAFGAFLGLLAGEDCELQPPGRKWENAGYVRGPKRAIAWRVLDAQYFGVAQRRRRVFVVASAREGFDPAAVLFECEGVRRDTAPSRETEKAVAALTANGVGTCGADDNRAQAGHLIPATGFRMVAFGEYADDGTASTMKARDYKDATDRAVMSVHGTQDPDTNVELAHTLGRNHGQENALIAFSSKDYGGDATVDMSPTLRACGHSNSHANAGAPPAVVYSVSLRGRDGGATAELGDEVSGCLRASSGGGDKPHVLAPVLTQYGNELAGTLTARYDSSPCADRGQNMVVAAFAENSRQEVRFEGGDGQITGALSSGGGKVGQGYPAAMVGMAVRRLTPVECERLQGFPDHKINITISVSNDGECDDLCSDHPKKSVRVGTKNPKLLRYALGVDGDELPSNVKFVGLSSKRNPEKPSEHVAAHALIDLERMHLQIRSAGKSILSVSIADEQNQSPLPIPGEDFARVAALMMQQAVKITATGKAELAASETCSSHQEHGRLRSRLYGQEISELACDAELFTKLVSEHLKSITSQAGRSSLNSEQMFAISSCFVATAISGFIPEQMRKGNSFALNVTVSHGHTNIPVNGKLASDGPRYKAIGNSMAVPVMRWIGKRIKLHLEAL